MQSSILKTAPLKYEGSDKVVVVSMVGHNTLFMYLLAIKSFMKFFGYGNIEAIDDGSLTPEDRQILNSHIPGISISNANDVDTHDCPTYISWKRLFRVRELAESSYVIQLDSDTVSVGNLVEVHNNAKNNRGFVIGSNKWATGVDVTFLKNIVSQWKSTHVQARAEQCFHKIEHFKDGTEYLRGCAGFAGYPKGFASIDDIRKLSKSIQEHVGDDWMQWGSEQTTTLCLISKQKESSILTWPEYQNYGFPETSEPTDSMNFIHFIGTNRFNDSEYCRLMKKFIDEEYFNTNT